MAISGTILKGMELSRQQSAQGQTEQSEVTNIVVATDKHEFAKMVKPWAELLKCSGNSNIYLSHDWLYTWWLWFAEQSSSELCIISLYCNKSLIAVAPFYIENNASNPISTKSTLRLLGQSAMGEMDSVIADSEQLDIITNGNQNDRSLVLNSLVNYLKKGSHYSKIVFQGVTEQSLLFQIISLFPQSQTCVSNIKKQALSLVLPASFDAFISAQNLLWRVNYRGNKKKMGITGNAEIRKYSQPDDIHSGLQSLTQILCTQQRKSSAGKCFFDGEHYMKFHDDICHLLSLKNRVEIVSLVMDGRLLASLCYYRADNEVIQIYQMAAIRGDGIRFSPMLLLMAHVIEEVIKRGCPRIDFLSSYIPDESGKECIKDKSTELYTLEWRKNRVLACFVKSARNFYKVLHVG